jgi:hypothetical protein
VKLNLFDGYIHKAFSYTQRTSMWAPCTRRTSSRNSNLTFATDLLLFPSSDLDADTGNADIKGILKCNMIIKVMKIWPQESG